MLYEFSNIAVVDINFMAMAKTLSVLDIVMCCLRLFILNNIRIDGDGVPKLNTTIDG